MAMENKKQMLLIVCAVAAGLVAVGLTSSYVTSSIQQQTQQLKEEYEARQKEMVAAIQQQNEQKMVALQQEIQRVKAEQEENTRKQVAELVKLQPQAGGQMARRVKPSLAVKTPAGKRAVTIQIDSLAAVGGLLNPGDFVDVIAQLSVPGGGMKSDAKTVTAMAFQNLQVLAVNTNLDETGVYYDQQQTAPAVKVTVAVDPKEAGLLTFADKNGKLELALRAPQEDERLTVEASTWKTLADYVLKNQGADINLPDSLKGVVTDSKAEQPKSTETNIQIFRGGKEL